VRGLLEKGADKDEIMRSVDMKDCMPVPAGEEARAQAAHDVSRMYDELRKGYP